MVIDVLASHLFVVGLAAHLLIASSWHFFIGLDQRLFTKRLVHLVRNLLLGAV